MRAAVRRRPRLRRLVAAAGRAAAKIFTVGIRAAAVYGDAVTGIKDSDLDRLQSLAAACLPPFGSASRRLKLALHGDPNATTAVAAARRWSKEVWLAVHRDPIALSIGTLHEAWNSVNGCRPTAGQWSSVRGPIGAAMCELARLGWKWTKPFCMTSDLGVNFELGRIGPKQVQLELNMAWARRSRREAATAADSRGGGPRSL